jgi:hypothetical protein
MFAAQRHDHRSSLRPNCQTGRAQFDARVACAAMKSKIFGCTQANNCQKSPHPRYIAARAKRQTS